MATYTHGAIYPPSGIPWFDVEILGDDPTAQYTPTLIIIPNSDGTQTRLIGNGFAGGNNPTAGTITQVQRTNAAGTTIYESITGLNHSLVALFSLPGEGNAAPFNFFLSGADSVSGNAGVDFLLGGPGADSLNGAGGIDFADYASATAGLTANLATQVGTGDALGDTYVAIENLRGSNFNDSLTGDVNSNRVEGGSGDDVLFGGGGNDTLVGGDGFDNLIGGGGNDLLIGGPAPSGPENFGQNQGARANYSGVAGPITAILSSTSTVTSTDPAVGTDTLVWVQEVRGTNSSDQFTATTSFSAQFGLFNTFEGLDGNDTFTGNGQTNVSYSQANGAVSVNLATGVGQAAAIGGATNVGVDTIILGNLPGGINGVIQATGGNFNDILLGDTANNSLQGNGGDDTLVGGRGFNSFRPGGGNDTVDGNPDGQPDGSYDDGDTVTYEFDNNGIGVTVDLNAGTANDPFGGVDTLIDIERATGTGFNDTFISSTTANLDEQRYRGLAGNDTITGGVGDDTLDYQRDARFNGTAGIIIDLVAGSGTDGFGDTDTFTNIENIIGTESADTMFGDAGDNGFRLLGGNDVVDGRGGSDGVSMYVDDVIGGAGATVNLATGTATGIAGDVSTLISIEEVGGSFRNDNITGSGGADRLTASMGDDTISAGGGDDLVNASFGADTVDGGAGFDYLSYLYDPRQATYFHFVGTGVTVNLTSGLATDLDGAIDQISGFEALVGSFLADSLTGNSSPITPSTVSPATTPSRAAVA